MPQITRPKSRIKNRNLLISRGTLQENTNKTMTTNINEKPDWFDANPISETLDAREMLKAGQHPLADVLTRTSALQSGQIFELITPFTPMPLIEKVIDKGFSAYVNPVNDSEIHTYFRKA